MRRAAAGVDACAGSPIFGAIRLSVSCHIRPTGFSGEVPSGSLGDGLGQSSLTVVAGVQIDESCPAAGMAHTFHQLTEIGAGLGH